MGRVKDIGEFFSEGGTKEDFLELREEAKPYTIDKSKGNDGGNDSDSEEDIPLTQELIELTLESGCEVYLDSDKDPIIVFPEKPLVAFPIKSKVFHRWLSGNYYDYSRKGFSNETFSVVVNTLEGQAYQEDQIIKLYNRIAKVEDVIYCDLGNDKTVVRIDSKGWKKTTNCPVKFKRFKHQLPQVDPVTGGELSNVLGYINIFDPQEQLLFLTYIIAAFIPDIPRVVLVHIGDQGAAKSTAMRVVRSLIDPSSAELLIPPSDIPELALAANHNYCLYLDNLSYLSDQLSDVLCRLVTGVGFTKRKLYTDSDDILLNQIVAVGITGITLVATKPDLLDRCLILRFQRISDEKREDEGDFWQRFNNEKPYILGAIFTALSKVLQIIPNLKLSQKPRMADYAKYAVAAAIALGGDAEMFLTAFAENVKRQNNAAIEASAVAQVVIDFMSDKEEWEGSSSELHGQLKVIAENANLEIGGKNGFPKASNWLWRKIQPIRPNLTAIGIYASHAESSSSSAIKLTKHSYDEKNTANTATQAENTASNTNDVAIENKDAAINIAIDNLVPTEPAFNNLHPSDGTMATVAVSQPPLDNQDPEKTVEQLTTKEAGEIFSKEN